MSPLVKHDSHVFGLMKHEDASDWPSASGRLKDLCPRPLVYEDLNSIYRVETI